MNKEILQITLQFLQRVDLKGSEVMAFNKVIEELNKELQKDTQEEI